MRKNLFLIIAFLAILSSCSRQDTVQPQQEKQEEKKAKNPEFYGKAAEIAIDSFFNALPDEIEMDYTTGREIHTMSNGQKKVYRISSPTKEGIAKKGDITIIDTTEPDDGGINGPIPGAIIYLEGKYHRESDSFLQSEFISNPVDTYGQLKVYRSLIGTTRWMEGFFGMWKGYVNYVVYRFNTIERTKQVSWKGKLWIPVF